MRKPIFFRDALPSVKSADFIDCSPKISDFVGSSGNPETENIRTIVLLENLGLEEQTIVKDFLSLLKVENATNFGISIFDSEGVFVYYSVPTIGLNEKKELVLQIGISQSGSPYEAVYLPLTYKKAEKTYSIGKDVTAKLVPLPNPMDETDIRNFITIKSESHTFHIPFKFDYNTKSSIDFETHWEDGTFDQVVQPFFKTALSLSKGFKNAFKTGQFPASGVLLLLIKGSLSIGEIKGKPVTSSRWSLLASSHPDLLVVTGKTDQEQLTTLESIGTVFSPESCTATKDLMKYIGNQMPNAGNYYLLHLVRINKNTKNPAHIPTHAGTGQINSFKANKLRKTFPQVFKSLNTMLEGQESQNGNSWLPSANSNVDQTIEIKAEPLSDKEFQSLTEGF